MKVLVKGGMGFIGSHTRVSSRTFFVKIMDRFDDHFWV